MPTRRLGSTHDGPAPTVRVRVRGGYEPSVLRARVGEPLRVVFTREETASCSEHVVFPAFGKSAMLPPFEDVALVLVPERAGEYEFTCQLGVLRGRLVVDDEERARSVSTEVVLGVHEACRRSWAAKPGDTAMLALVGVVCSAPFLLLVTVPLVGWRAGGALALVWIAVVATACFAVCARRLGEGERARAGHFAASPPPRIGSSARGDATAEAERSDETNPRRLTCTGTTVGTGSG